VLASVLKRAGGLGVGTAIGQAIVLAGTPWLVRIYGPAHFGLLALLITITNISVATGCARFDLALPSAKDADVPALSRLCVLIAAFAATAVALIAFAVSNFGGTQGALNEIVRHPILLGLCVFFAATFQAANSVLLCHGNIRAMAALRGTQGALFVAFALWPQIGLLWAQVLSFAPGCAFLPRVLLTKSTKGAGIASVASSYRIFAVLGLPGAILDVIGYSLCIWIVTFAYGAAGSGELSQVQRIVGAPLMLVSISLGQILLRQSAEQRDDLPQLKLLIKHLLLLFAGGAGIALIVLALIGKPVLSWILGSKWHVDTAFIVAISAAVFIRASVSPVSTILATFRRFDLALRWQLLYFASAASLFTLASRSLSLSGFVIFYAVHEAVLYAIYLRVIMRIFRKA
jgi:O-antigen/teichoic acid export membrane protein